MDANDIQTRQKIIRFGDKIDEIAKLIRKGGVIILPAKTIYGLSCRFDRQESLKRIYGIKSRKKSISFIVLISKLEELNNLTSSINKNTMKLIKCYWDKEEPDPLTMIFKKNSNIPDYITCGKDTIAVRRAEFKFVRDIIDASHPIISTSATLSGTKTNPMYLSDISEEILKKVDLMVDMGEKLLGIESTIIDTSGSDIKLLREGAVNFNDILQKLQIKI